MLNGDPLPFASTPPMVYLTPNYVDLTSRLRAYGGAYILNVRPELTPKVRCANAMHSSEGILA